MRGVHQQNLIEKTNESGSSPHARGPSSPSLPPGCVIGIIPACAGSIIDLGDSGSMPEDHPRMRGVHFGLLDDDTADKGSSPHARGPFSSPGGLKHE